MLDRVRALADLFTSVMTTTLGDTRSLELTIRRSGPALPAGRLEWLPELRQLVDEAGGSSERYPPVRRPRGLVELGITVYEPSVTGGGVVGGPLGVCNMA